MLRARRSPPKPLSHYYIGQEIIQAQETLHAEAPLNLEGLLQVCPDSGLPSPGNSGINKISKKKAPVKPQPLSSEV